MKHGFKFEITFEALDSVIRNFFGDIPEGQIASMWIDQEKGIAGIKYLTGESGPKVGEASEFPTCPFL